VFDLTASGLIMVQNT
jgi:hypothetical protein